MYGWSLGLGETPGEGRDAQADVLHGLVVILAAVVGWEEVLGAERGRHGQIPFEGAAIDSLPDLFCEKSGFEALLSKLSCRSPVLNKFADHCAGMRDFRFLYKFCPLPAQRPPEVERNNSWQN